MDPGSHRRLGGSCRALPSVVIYGFSQVLGKGKDDLLVLGALTKDIRTRCPPSEGCTAQSD